MTFKYRECLGKTLHTRIRQSSLLGTRPRHIELLQWNVGVQSRGEADPTVSIDRIPRQIQSEQAGGGLQYSRR